MATIALTADVTDRTHSPWWVSALFIVTFLPSVIVGLVAGPLVDRLSRKKLIVAADIARIGVFVALPFVGSALAIVALAAVAGVANSFFRPAVLAGVPNLIPEEDLAHGTSLLQATDWAAATLGPILGGVIVSASGPDLVYWINAATFLLSVLLLLRIPARLLQSEQAITRGHWRDLADGLGAFRRSAAMLTVLVAFGFAMLATGLINVSEIFLVERALHRGAFGYGLLVDRDRRGTRGRQPGQRRAARVARADRHLSARVPALGGGDLRRGDLAEHLGRRARDGGRRLRERADLPDDRPDRAALYGGSPARPRVHADHQRPQPAARDRDGRGRRAHRSCRAARWTYVVAAALLGAGGFAALVLSRGITAEAEAEAMSCARGARLAGLPNARRSRRCPGRQAKRKLSARCPLEGNHRGFGSSSNRCADVRFRG